MIDKKELKKFLIENETHTIENTEEKLLDFVKGTMLNRNDVIDQDDQSHHRQEERLRKQLDKQVHDHHHHLEEIEALNFNPSQVVEPGAVIKGRIQTRSATPVDSVNEGGVLRAVDQQFSVHSQR